MHHQISSRIKLADAFCGQLTEEYGKTMGMVLKTLLCLGYHLPRSIASQDGDAVAREKDGVLTVPQLSSRTLSFFFQVRASTLHTVSRCARPMSVSVNL